MKRVYVIGSAIAVLLLMFGCGDNNNSHKETPKSTWVDKTTGFSREAVDAQLKIGIYSPYHLIKATEGAVNLILAEDLTKEILNKILIEQTAMLMPKESKEVRDEIVNYLVKYFMLNSL